MNPDDLLKLLVERGGSDLFVHADGGPSIRIDGDVLFVPGVTVPQDVAQAFYERVLNENQREQFVQSGEANAAYEVAEVGRFRVNVYSQRGQLGFVCRHVPSMPPVLAELGLPTKPVTTLARVRRGLVLVTGTAGCGKSTTLAGILQWLNLNNSRHIVTLEDPIEFLFRNARSTVHQRELGVDTVSYATGLRHVVRQSPDVIMVGEMRDRETVEAVLAAAAAGHLVLSTLHTVDACQTVERILWFFPQDQHALIRHQLSMLLEGVISQRLVQRADGRGRVAVVELLLGTPAVREMLAKGKTAELADAIADGADKYGSQSYAQAFAKLVRAGTVSLEDALAASDDPEAIQIEMKGGARPARSRSPDGAEAPPAPPAPYDGPARPNFSKAASHLMSTPRQQG